VTTSLFDISADLDTPVSAYLQLKPFRPRFLLESVEGGERLARYSFIGFGDSLEFRLDASGLRLGAERLPRPANQADLLAALRRALAAAPRPDARDAGFPLHGGLVGVASYDLVRFFERLPSHARVDDDCPEAHYIAPRSMLVFDHLTRRAALLHAGPEHERQALGTEPQSRGVEPELQAVPEADEGIARQAFTTLHAFEQEARPERLQFQVGRHRGVEVGRDVEQTGRH